MKNNETFEENMMKYMNFGFSPKKREDYKHDNIMTTINDYQDTITQINDDIKAVYNGNKIKLNNNKIYNFDKNDKEYIFKKPKPIHSISFNKLTTYKKFQIAQSNFKNINNKKKSLIINRYLQTSIDNTNKNNEQSIFDKNDNKLLPTIITNNIKKNSVTFKSDVSIALKDINHINSLNLSDSKQIFLNRLTKNTNNKYNNNYSKFSTSKSLVQSLNIANQTETSANTKIIYFNKNDKNIHKKNLSHLENSSNIYNKINDICKQETKISNIFNNKLNKEIKEFNNKIEENKNISIIKNSKNKNKIQTKIDGIDKNDYKIEQNNNPKEVYRATKNDQALILSEEKSNILKNGNYISMCNPEMAYNCKNVILDKYGNEYLNYIMDNYSFKRKQNKFIKLQNEKAAFKDKLKKKIEYLLDSSHKIKNSIFNE
jgi:hypothetical protein